MELLWQGWDCPVLQAGSTQAKFGAQLWTPGPGWGHQWLLHPAACFSPHLAAASSAHGASQHKKCKFIWECWCQTGTDSTGAFPRLSPGCDDAIG